MSLPKRVLDAIVLAGMRPHALINDPDVLVGPFTWSGVLPDNGTTAVDLTAGEGTSGAPLRNEDFDVQFPSSNGVDPDVLLLIDAVSIDIGQGDGTNGISPANWAALIAPGGARLHWARGNQHRRFEFATFANLMAGQTISDTNATTANLRLNPREERRRLIIPTGHLEVDMKNDTFEIEIGAAVNFTGTFTPPFHLFLDALAVAKRAVPGYTAGPPCNRVSENGAQTRIKAQHDKQTGRVPSQISK